MARCVWVFQRLLEPVRSCRIAAKAIRDPQSYRLCHQALTHHEAIQDPLELIQLIQFVKNRKLSYVLEIGTFLGGTLNIWCQLAEDDATIVSIDRLPAQFDDAVTVRGLQALKKGRQDLVLIRDSSHTDESLASVKAALGSNQLDLLLIDGDHTYDGVKLDYEMYQGLVKPGGLTIFHDINPRAESATEGVARFWKEIRDQGTATEFLGNHPRVRFGWGIGVLEKKE